MGMPSLSPLSSLAFTVICLMLCLHFHDRIALGTKTMSVGASIWSFLCSFCNGAQYCWFSRDVPKIQSKKLSILPRFYFHDVLEQLKTNFHTNFCFKRVLGFVIEYT